VRAALAALGLALSPKRITLNLASADVVKKGSHFDLPIPSALLVAIGGAARSNSALDWLYGTQRIKFNQYLYSG
jgi:predicted ATPase with chaperone activity